jgi:hypothetical protein
LINPDVDGDYYVGSLVGRLMSGIITNCDVRGGSVSGSHNSVGGLVGYNWAGTINNCSSSSNVTGRHDIGGLMGTNSGTITNSYSEGSVSGTQYSVGGLAGGNSGTITNCYSEANVLGHGYVGGLAGRNDEGTINNSFSKGSVAGNWGAGGLVGYNQNDSTINCSYSTASVAGDECVGGFVGSNWRSTITNSYSEGNVVGNNYVGGLVARNLRDSTITNSYSSASVSGNENVGGLVGYHDSGSYTKCFWDSDINPDVNGIGNATDPNVIGESTANMQTQSTFTDAGWDFVGETTNGTEDIWKICEGEGYPRFSWEKYGGGSGGSDNPYLISNSCQMNAIGADPNDWDKYFKLMADIDLSVFTGTSFNIIGKYIGWEGPANKSFTGAFDGNGYTISNFTYDSNDTHSIGLFGYVDEPNAEIKDLALIDANVYAGATECAALMVGRLSGGTITNCYVDGGSISGFNGVGGLVGENAGTITDCSSSAIISGEVGIGGLVGINVGTIIYCYSSGDVIGFGDVGGLVALNIGTISNCYSDANVSEIQVMGGLVATNEGTITNCYSSGSVWGDRYVGGLVGWNNGTITNCYAETSVSGIDDMGGLAGLNRKGTISNCYSTGSVSDTGVSSYDYAFGGFIGDNNGTITNFYSMSSAEDNADIGGLVGDGPVEGVINSFWDVNTSGQTYSAGGIGKTTSEMKTRGTFTNAGWDFVGETENSSEDIWTVHEGQDYPKLVWKLVNFIGWYEVDFADFASFANQWGQLNCGESNDCDGLDLDFSDAVDSSDLKILCNYWLAGL